MEFEPFTPPSSETGKDEKKNKRKKSVRFGVPLAKVESGQDSAGANPEDSRSKGAVQELADSIAKNKDSDKQDKPWETALESKTKADKAAPAESVAEAVNEQMDVLVEKKDLANKPAEKDTKAAAELTGVNDADAEPDGAAETEETPEEYREMLRQELPEGWKGSERVVDLQGVTGIDHVIPLRGEAQLWPPKELPVEQPEAPAAFENPYPVFNGQPEQPRQAREEASAKNNEAYPGPEVPPYTASGGGSEATPPGGGDKPPSPPPPPEAPGSPAEQPSEPEPNPVFRRAAYEPATTYTAEQSSGGPAATNLAPGSGRRPTGERPATKEELDDAFHRSAKLHGQRGALSGLLVGTYFANRRLRRRQLKESKELERQGRELQLLKREVRAPESHQPRPFVTENRYENPSRPDKLGATTTAEHDRQAQQAEQNKVQPAELLAIPENHQLQTSAWHNIEIDKRTGRPVETPAFQYGHEYYRERAQEGQPQQQRNAATGSTVLAATGMGQNPAPSSGQPIPGAQGQAPPIPVATTQGAPSGGPSSQAPEKRSGTAGPIWPWIVALIGVILCLVVALR